MRALKRSLRRLLRACGRMALGGAAGFFFTLFLLSELPPEAALAMAVPILVAGALVALLWPMAFPRRRRRVV